MLAASCSSGQDDHFMSTDNPRTNNLKNHSKTYDDALDNLLTIPTINQETIQKELLANYHDKHSNNDDSYNSQVDTDAITKSREQKGMALLKAFVLEVKPNCSSTQGSKGIRLWAIN